MITREQFDIIDQMTDRQRAKALQRSEDIAALWSTDASLGEGWVTVRYESGFTLGICPEGCGYS